MERQREIQKYIRKMLFRSVVACSLAFSPLVIPTTHPDKLPPPPAANSGSFSLESQSNYLRQSIVMETVSGNETQKDPELIKLENYLSSLQDDQKRLKQIVEEDNIFSGFKNLTEAQRVDDFNRYFPIYRAADLKYDVPWLLLWIIHTDETAVSRDLNLNQGEQVGAMQVSKEYEQDLAEATEGKEFLSSLPDQRQSNDWKEILKASLFIRNKAESRKFLSKSPISDEEAILDVVRYDYSAVQYGEVRANQYLKMKSLFN